MKKKSITEINIILLFVIFFSSKNILSSYVKIVDPEKQAKKPIRQSRLSYHALNVIFEYPTIEKNVRQIKEQLSDISILLGRLIYVRTYNDEIEYNNKVLKRFKIKLTKEEQNNFVEKTYNADLLILVKFIKYKNRTAINELYTRNDEDDGADSRRTYIALLKIKKDFDFDQPNSETIFKLGVIREIFKILGFRREFLKTYFVRNNFAGIPSYLIEDMNAFKAYKKYLNFTDREYNGDKFNSKTRFYYSFWDDEYGISDIMSETLNIEASITELTIGIFNELEMFTINQCDIFKYKAGFGNGFNCVRPTQDCIDIKEIDNYFLEYNFYDDYDIKCYLNTKENIKNKQCGTIYGNVANKKLEYRFCPLYKQIKYNPFKSMTPIPELNVYESQKLKVFKNSESCPPGNPRGIFFSVPPSIFDEYKNETNINELINDLNNINKDVEYDEIILDKKNKKYYVTYEAYDDYYSRESVWKVLNYSGIIRSFSNFFSHNLLIKNPDRDDLEEMGMVPTLQKIFSYTNFKIISHKDLTYFNYYTMRRKFPKDFDYMPETFSYPEDQDEIETKFSNYELNENDLWLIKPKTGSLGEGIYIFEDLKKTPDVYLISRYISNPHLINKLKYDFRIYVLISGLSPLKMYLYKEGMVRFATEEYTLDKEHLSELYRHLTNVAINEKNKKDYKKAHNADTQEGSKWSLQVYEKYCNENNIDYKYIRKQMGDIAIKSILSVIDQFLEKIKDNGTQDRNHFKLLGFDFLVDENLKVYLLEINDRPSLIMGDINDRKLKPQLVADCLNIVGVFPYSHDYKDGFAPYDNKDDNEDVYENSERKRIEDVVNSSICELGRPRGRFELIFPLKDNIDYYKQFFSSKSMENSLLWKYVLNN